MKEAVLDLHYQLFKVIDDHLVRGNFERLKADCGRWIVPAQLESITTTRGLLDQLQKQGVVKVGCYDKLVQLLALNNLNKVKEDVERLAKKIAQLPEHEDTKVKELDDTTQRTVSSAPNGLPVDKLEKLTHATITMNIPTGPTETLVITPAPNQGHPMICDVLVSWRIQMLQLVPQLVFDGLAICSGVTVKAEGYQSKAGAVEHAMKDITPLLLGSGVRVQYGDKSWMT